MRFRTNWRGFITPAIRNIVLICTGVFLLEVLLRLFVPNAVGALIDYTGLVPYSVVFRGFVWQVFTYLFLHDPRSITHLLFNMLFLWMFGVDLERTWGQKRFYTYFFLTGASAGVITVVVKLVVAHYYGAANAIVPTIGASGAIYGVIMAAAILFPDRQVWLIPFPVTIPMWVYALVAGALEFFFTLGATGDNVSHVCHLGGMLAGYIYLRRGSHFFGFRNRYTDWKRRRMKKKFEVYQRRHEEHPPSRPDDWVN